MAYKLFCDSFDTWSTTATTNFTNSRWTLLQASGVGGNNLQTSSGNGRRGSASLRLTTASGGTVNATTAFTASTHVVIGFWHRSPLSTGSTAILLLANTTTLITVTINAAGFITVTLGSTTYTSTKQLPATSAFIELGVVIGDSGSLEVRVNGSSAGWLALTGADTKPGADTTVNRARLQVTGASSITVDFDDLYITYGDELRWLGDIRVDALALTADSTPQDWTPDTGNAWERLNNTSAGYITGTTLDDESLFDLADYTPATTAIHGVQVSAYARKTDAGSRSMAIEVKSDTTTDVGDTFGLGDTTTEYRQVWLTDPDTASAWTDGGLDALEIGVKVMD